MYNKRLTYEEVKLRYNKYEYELLDTEYISSRTKMSVRCPNGHIFQTTLKSFTQGNRCAECFGNKKHDIKYAKKYVENYNYICESTEYINAVSKLKLICPVGHKIEMLFSNFHSGRRCIECAGHKPRTKENIIEYLKEYQYELLSEEFLNVNTKIKMKCPNGHTFEMKFSHFKNGRRCRHCYNQTGENNPNWKPDRTRRRRSTYLQFDKRKRSILKDDPLYEKYLKNKEEYHIDHIFPKMAFIENELDIKYDKALVKKICNLRENLQILTYKENISKHSKYNQNDFMNWFNTKLKEYDIEIKV